MKIHNSTRFIHSCSGWIDTQYLPTTDDQKPFLYHHLLSCFCGHDQRVGIDWIPDKQMEKAHVRVSSCVIDRLFSDCVTGHLKTHFFHVVFQWLSSTGGFSLEAKRKRGWQSQERETEERSHGGEWNPGTTPKLYYPFSPRISVDVCEINRWASSYCESFSSRQQQF